MPNPPQNPAGPFTLIEAYAERDRARLTETIQQAPAKLREAISGMTDEQLETPYRNWTIRQITHHIADSHLNSIIRFKWTLTEDRPTIKAYEEGDWVQLVDAKHGDVEPSLLLLEGLHSKWVQVLESMNPDQYQRTFLHPQSGEEVSLWHALNNYAWHGVHHTAQILWLKDQYGW